MKIHLPLFALLLVLAACAGTVTPRIVVPAEPSYSGTARTSGIVERNAAGWVVDGIFRERYNALIEIYGRDVLPPLTRDAGITLIVAAATPDAERWLIDPRHFDLMLTMNVKKHSGIAPVKS